jgi:hypothetical protein
VGRGGAGRGPWAVGCGLGAVGCGVGLRTRVRSRGDGLDLRWGLGWAGVSGLCAPPAVRGLLFGALSGQVDNGMQVVAGRV